MLKQKKKKHQQNEPKKQNNSTTNDGWDKKGDDHYHAGRYEEAENAYNNALILASVQSGDRETPNLPSQQEANNMIVKLRKCIINCKLKIADDLFNKAFYDGAKKVFDEAQEIDPENEIIERYWWNKYYQLSAENKHDAAAERACRYALAYYPKSIHSIPYWLEIADDLFDKGFYDEAKQAFDEAYKINPTNPDILDYWWKKGNQLYILGKHENAEKAYNYALSIAPTNVHAIDYWYRLGDSSTQQGHLDNAKAAYRKAQLINPKNLYSLEYWRSRGDVLYANNFFDEAIWAYNIALRMDRHNVYPLKYWLKMAEVCENKGLLNEATRVYKIALKMNPKDMCALLKMGDLLIKRGLEDKAKKYNARAFPPDVTESSQQSEENTSETTSTNTDISSNSKSSIITLSSCEDAFFNKKEPSAEKTPTQQSEENTSETKSTSTDSASNSKSSKTTLTPGSDKLCHTFRTYRLFKRSPNSSLPKTSVQQKILPKTLRRERFPST